MHLLVIILYREDLLDEVLSALVELEITGAPVIEGTSMEQVLSEDVPIFAGLWQSTGGHGHTKTILAPITDPGLLDSLKGLLEESGVDFRKPDVGRAFLLSAEAYLGPEDGEGR